MSLVRALVECGVAPEAINEEFHRSEGTRLQHIMPAFDIIHRLPCGICAQLFAIPVIGDAESPLIDVAVVDISDHHAQQELAYHCRKSVRLVPAAYQAIVDGLERIQRHFASSQTYRPRVRVFTPAFGSAAPVIEVPPTRHPSEIPIPLVRVSHPPSPVSHSRPVLTVSTPVHDGRSASCVPRSVDSSARISLAMPVTVSSATPRAEAPASIPALQSAIVEHAITYSSALSQPVSRVWPEQPMSPTSNGKLTTEGPDLLRRIVDAYESSIDELAEATSRDDVVVAIMRCMQSLGRSAAVLTVRQDTIEGWVCSPSLGTHEQFRGVRISRYAPSVFVYAVEHGSYFGPLFPADKQHPNIARWSLGDSDVSLSTVVVQNRPVLLVFLAQPVDSMIATHTAERVARASAKALLRLLQADKRYPR